MTTAAEISASARTRPVFRRQRARRLRRRLRRPHQGREEPRHRAAGPEDPREPRPPRRRGRRQADGRRRRHPDPAARRAVPRGDGQAGRRPAAARRIRRRHDLPAQGTRLAPGLRAGNRARHQGRRPGAAGLARCAGQPRDADVARRAREGADPAPGLHRPRQRRDRAGRAGAQALRDPQDGQRRHPEPEAQAQQGILRSEHVAAARWSTRACCWPTRSARTTSTCRTSAASRPWAWCTSASRPTPSPSGRWPTRTATSPTTARSTRSRATTTG